MIDKMGLYYITPCKNSDTVVRCIKKFDEENGPAESKVEIAGYDDIVTVYHMIIVGRKKEEKKDQESSAPVRRKIHRICNKPSYNQDRGLC